MGLFDKVSDNISKAADNQLQKREDKKLQKQREKEEKQLLKQKEKEEKELDKQRIKNQKDSIFDFDYGIKCNVRMPPREVVTSSGGLTKGAATLGFGLVGMAATSGTKTKVKTEYKPNIRLAVKDQGLLLYNAAPDKSNVNIDWNMIADCEYKGDKFVKTEDCSVILVNGHRMGIAANTKHNKKDAGKQLYEIIKNNMCGTETDAWENTPEENTTSDADELLKWHDLYEKGVISQEEFEAKKKELL